MKESENELVIGFCAANPPVNLVKFALKISERLLKVMVFVQLCAHM
jgi:hypothetical protein